MLFNSYEFIFIFLPIVLMGYYYLLKYFGCNIAKYFLVFASLVFYSYWDMRNLPILAISIVVNIVIGHWLSKEPSKRILFLGVVFNIFYLIYFKYTNFMFINLRMIFGEIFVSQDIVLPLGISFFTFTQIAYLIDIYKGETKEYRILDYLLFVTFFPHLIAGPILYHKDMISQFMDKYRYKVNYENIIYGIFWFTVGLFKKVAIADKFAKYADQLFNISSEQTITILDAWFGSLAYTLQLYFDFSGYSEMAIGLGLLFNFNLPWNFNYPYASTSIIEFWRKWHITLSTFLKNYLYIPLGGNRKGEVYHFRNIMITMMLGGLWHGAGWTFVLWGGIHGVAICINHLWKKSKFILPRWINWILTFNVINLAWIFFRAESFNQAINIVMAMGNWKTFHIYNSFLAKYFSLFALKDELLVSSSAYWLTIVFVGISMYSIDTKILRNIRSLTGVVILSMIFVYCILQFSTVTEFLYFQF